MTNSDPHHFISTTRIYGDGPLMVVTIDAYKWWRSLSVTISYFSERRKISPKLIGDGQKSLCHQKMIVAIPYGCQGTMESNHQPLACKAGALPLS